MFSALQRSITVVAPSDPSLTGDFTIMIEAELANSVKTESSTTFTLTVADPEQEIEEE